MQDANDLFQQQEGPVKASYEYLTGPFNCTLRGFSELLVNYGSLHKQPNVNNTEAPECPLFLITCVSLACGLLKFVPILFRGKEKFIRIILENKF